MNFALIMYKNLKLLKQVIHFCITNLLTILSFLTFSLCMAIKDEKLEIKSINNSKYKTP